MAAQSSQAVYKSNLAYAYALSGQREEALKLLTELETLSKRSYVLPFTIAMIYLGLGDDNGFFKYMTKQAEDGTIWNMRDFPPFRRVRKDPRFSSLMRKMNL